MRSEEARAFLQSKADRSFRHRDERRAMHGVAFEDSRSWLPLLCDSLLVLSSKMLGADGHFAPPVLALVEELEDISCCLVQVSGEGAAAASRATWAASLLVRMRVHKGTLLSAYLSLAARARGERLAHLLGSITHVLCSWADTASGYSAASVAERKALLLSARSGLVARWLDGVDSALAAFRGQPQMLSISAQNKVAIVADIERRTGEFKTTIQNLYH